MNIEIKVITNAKRREIHREGISLKVRLMSLPVEGKANEELIEYLSDIFSVKKSEIKILRGDRDKRKLISLPVDESAIKAVAER